MLASSLTVAAFTVLLYTKSSVAQALPLRNEREAHTNTSAKGSTVTTRMTSTYLPTTTITAFTFVTPFPSAKPIPITSQGQTVTTFLPLYTVCPAAPYQMPSSMLPNATDATGTSATGLMARKRQADPSATPYYPLYNTSTPSAVVASTSCSTVYSTITTSICHTTLTPAFDFPTTITDCNEKVTFSRTHDLATRSDGIAELMTSEYAVVWSSATAGLPSGTIEARVCHSTGDCSTHLETWRPVVETATAISTVPVTINSLVSAVSARSNKFPIIDKKASADQNCKPINIELNDINTATTPAPSHGQDYAINSALPTQFSLSTTIDVINTLSMSVMYTDTLDATATATGMDTPDTTSTITSTSTIRITIAVATETAVRRKGI